MRLRERFKSRTFLIVGVVVLVGLGATAAYAATQTFSDVPPDHIFYADIEKMAAQKVINGFPDGTFRPNNPITRGQAAAMFNREQTYMLTLPALGGPLDQINRGCPACHPTTVGNPADPPFTAGRPDPSRGNAPTFSLKWEAMGGDATSARFILHNGLPDTATINTCLGCHAAGTGDQNGNGSGISLRVIVHPAHLNSGIFIGEFRGNCFTCHEITNEGEYDILTEAVAVNDKGIPEEIPTPGLQEPSAPGVPPSTTTTTAAPTTTTTVAPTTTTTASSTTTTASSTTSTTAPTS